MQATLNLGKKATFIKEGTFGTSVCAENLGDIASFVSNIAALTLTGLAKPSKLAKYQAVILNAGFVVAYTDWNNNAGFEGKNADVITFRINYTKA
jgi:hypothetical protein